MHTKTRPLIVVYSNKHESKKHEQRDLEPIFNESSHLHDVGLKLMMVNKIKTKSIQCLQPTMVTIEFFSLLCLIIYKKVTHPPLGPSKDKWQGGRHNLSNFLCIWKEQHQIGWRWNVGYHASTDTKIYQTLSQ